jgi:hypothetical protein
MAILRVDGAVRFKEEDVLRLLTENQGPKPRLLSLSPRMRSEVSRRITA